MPTKEHHQQVAVALNKACALARELPDTEIYIILSSLRAAYEQRALNVLQMLCGDMERVGFVEAQASPSTPLQLALQSVSDLVGENVWECRLMAGAVLGTQYLLALVINGDLERIRSLSHAMMTRAIGAVLTTPGLSTTVVH